MVEYTQIKYSFDKVVLDLKCKLCDKITNPSILNHLYLVATLMINYYGLNHLDDIYNIILRTNYIIDNNHSFKLTHTIRDVLSKDINYMGSNYVMSICNINVPNIATDIDGYSTNYTLCITNKRLNVLENLECLLREINKIFLSNHRPFRMFDKNTMLRCGLSYTNLNKNINYEKYKTINDIIIALQIEDMFKLLKHIVYDGNNKDLNKLLKKVHEYNTDYILIDCCLPLVNLFRPLFDDNSIKELLNKSMITGDLDNIYNEFDSVLGMNSYYEMSNRLDKLYNDFAYGNLGVKVSEYSISRDYVLIRDNFISKYLKKKYA